MPLPESALNVALASVLDRMNQNWRVTAEISGLIRDRGSLRIDIVVELFNGPRLVVENEFSPARSVEVDARGRLGKKFEVDGRVISDAIALRSPSVLKSCNTVEEAENMLSSLDFEYALLQLQPDHEQLMSRVHRVPVTPQKFLKGPITALAEFLLNAGANPFLLQESMEALDEGVQDAIGILSTIVQTSNALKSELANLLMQAFSDEDIAQGLGIAATLVINATLFQQQLAAQYPEVLSLAQMRGLGKLHQAGLIEQWRKILDINYWPIYSIAASVMMAIEDPFVASKFIQRLFDTTQKLIDLGVADTHDLCGVIFQRFMTERKHLASFYTRPESARLLAHLAIPDLDWADRSIYTSFKFADYACGTGALVHGVYQRLAQLHEFKGGDPSAEHAHMMEQNVTAADIVPSAAHLTATLLSSLFPHRIYKTSRVVVPNYGRVAENQIFLGSLELLDEEREQVTTLFPNPDDGKVVGPEGDSTLSYQLTAIPRSQDLVIMNPPYTRSMSDWIDGAHGTWKPYNALGNSEETQYLMRERERELTKGARCYNGYQSMPSAFCAVADKMIKEGGTFAFVLPTTSLQGNSWHKFRKMLAEDYFNVLVVSIAGCSASECAWSADTKLAEGLIVARKKLETDHIHDRSPRGTIVSLKRRPPNSMMATEYANEIKAVYNSQTSIRTVEDGPYGGTPIMVGGELVGEMLSVPISRSSWNVLGVRDMSLAQFAFQLRKGNLWFPSIKLPLQEKLSVRKIREFGRVGYADNNIANNSAAAFDRVSISVSPDFPMMWAKDSEN